MALPRSWLNRLRPTTLRTNTTAGANSPFPSFTFPILGHDRCGLAARTDATDRDSAATPPSPVAQLPQNEERGREPHPAVKVVAMDDGGTASARRRWQAGPLGQLS